MLNIFKNITFLIFKILLIFSLFSCAVLIDPNKQFNEKYSDKVDDLVSKLPQNVIDSNVKSQTPFGALSEEDVLYDSISRQQQYYPYYDIAKFGQVPPKYFLPNSEVYDQSRFNNPSNQIPQDMFEVSYEIRKYPPFKYQGARFDNIKIPNKDKYGVSTSLAQKDYLFAGNDAVQNSIDNIKENRKAYDAKNSQIIIDEQKQRRHHKKMVKIFGAEILSKKSKQDKNNSDKIAQTNISKDRKNDENS